MAERVWLGASSGAFSTAANWSGATVPIATDNLIFDGRAANSLSSGLSQSGITFASIRVSSAFTYNIGVIASGALTLFECGCTNLLIGEPQGDGSIGSGSPLLAFNFGAVANTTRVLNASTTGSSGFAPVMLKGTEATNVLIVTSGWIGVATNILNETSTIARLDVLGSDANVQLGGGCTLTTINQTAGNISFRSAVTTFDQQGGTATSEGSGAITTLTVGGRFVSNSTGTVTTATVINGGELDLSQNTASRIFTTTSVTGTGIVRFQSSDFDRVTLTNGVSVVNAAKSEQVIGLTNVNIKIAAP